LNKHKDAYGDRVIDPIELVLSKIDEKNDKIAEVSDRNRQLQEDILAILGSRSFRLGSSLTKPMRIARNRIHELSKRLN